MKKNYVMCMACGYLMLADEHHDVCPACGVASKAFTPYKSKVSEKREQVLGLHLHPIILHFPQAVVVFAFLLLALLPFLDGDAKDFITICARFNTVLLPLCILGGFLSGLLDGKIRFKSIGRPILKVKIMYSCLFFVLSIVAAVVILLQPLTIGINLLLLVLMAAAMIIAVILGRIGSKLTSCVLPG